MGSVIEELTNDPHYIATMKRQFIGWGLRTLMLIGEYYSSFSTRFPTKTLPRHKLEFKVHLWSTETLHSCRTVWNKDHTNFHSPIIFGQLADISLLSFTSLKLHDLCNIRQFEWKVLEKSEFS